MLKRLRASLANPSSIPQYRKDKIFLVLLYMVILSFIARMMNNKLTYYILFVVIALIMSIEITSAIFEAIREEKEEDDWE